VLWFVVSYNAWFVASLAAHGVVVCCLSYKAYYKRDNKPGIIRETTNHGTMRCKRGNKPGFIRETTNHSTMRCKRGNKPSIIRETTNHSTMRCKRGNKPGHHELKERQQTKL
jgi:hypothetical protein